MIPLLQQFALLRFVPRLSIQAKTRSRSSIIGALLSALFSARGGIASPGHGGDRMKSKRIIGLMFIFGAGMLSLCAARLGGRSRSEQEPTARCNVVVPKEWGEYIGAGSYGLEFKDEAGTIRFVKQFPCGAEGAPNISLEVRRK
jgi:hypothetical protein